LEDVKQFSLVFGMKFHTMAKNNLETIIFSVNLEKLAKLLEPTNWGKNKPQCEGVHS
jgi:hypothetical protein